MTQATDLGRFLLVVCRQSVEAAIRQIAPPRASPEPPALPAWGGIFVTLRMHGRLRGCVGTLDTTRPLPVAAAEIAAASALSDSRFLPVQPAELPSLRVEVSLLSQPVPMRNLEDLRLGVHGIAIRSGGRSSVFLPQVATDHGFTREQFLSRCCTEKAGLPPDAWRDPETSVLLFTTERFHEPD